MNCRKIRRIYDVRQTRTFFYTRFLFSRKKHLFQRRLKYIVFVDYSIWYSCCIFETIDVIWIESIIAGSMIWFRFDKISFVFQGKNLCSFRAHRIFKFQFTPWLLTYCICLLKVSYHRFHSLQIHSFHIFIYSCFREKVNSRSLCYNLR